MHLHEYQAKDILARYNVEIPPYFVVSSLLECEKVIEQEGLQAGVVKAQVHSGGRGKHGGVYVAHSAEALQEGVQRILGMQFSSNQTVGESLPVHQVLISPLVDIVSEFYLAITIDRKQKTPVIMVSPDGGVDIEEIAEKHPERLLILAVSSQRRLYQYQLRQIIKFMKWTGELASQAKILIPQLLQCFYDCDALLLEINPLVATASGHLVVLDAKMTIDDNALYRHRDLAEYYDPTQENARDVLARELGLSYVALQGNIGCLVNGAGLAMSTMDVLKLYGGEPANFLDVGGGASQQQIQEAVSLVLADAQVEVLFVNIFGGIIDCSVVAAGLVKAVSEGPRQVPMVVRLEGTNVELGKEIMQRSGIPYMFTQSMEEGAKVAVQWSQRK